MFTLEEAKCPYCAIAIAPPPVKKKKCRHCKKIFYIRTRCADRKKVIIREDEIMLIESEWDIYREVNEIIKGVSVSGLISKAAIQEVQKRYPAIKNVVDIIWKLLNEKLSIAMETSDWGLLHQIYNEMSYVLQREGKDSFITQVEAQKCSLRELSEAVDDVEILTTGKDACPECQKLSSQILTISEALAKMPLPVKNCSSNIFGKGKSFCRCDYLGYKLSWKRK